MLCSFPISYTRYVYREVCDDGYRAETVVDLDLPYRSINRWSLWYHCRKINQNILSSLCGARNRNSRRHSKQNKSRSVVEKSRASSVWWMQREKNGVSTGVYIIPTCIIRRGETNNRREAVTSHMGYDNIHLSFFARWKRFEHYSFDATLMNSIDLYPIHNPPTSVEHFTFAWQFLTYFHIYSNSTLCTTRRHFSHLNRNTYHSKCVPYAVIVVTTTSQSRV